MIIMCEISPRLRYEFGGATKLSETISGKTKALIWERNPHQISAV